MTKRFFAGTMAASLLVGGGIAGTVLVPGAASASTSTAATQPSVKTRQAALKTLVDKGTITQAQSDAVAEALKNGRRVGHLDHKAVAQALNLSTTELRTALQNKSIAEVARDKGIDVQTVINALVSSENALIDQAVKDGKITQDQANTRKAHTVDRVTRQVNRVHNNDKSNNQPASTSATPASSP